MPAYHVSYGERDMPYSKADFEIAAAKVTAAQDQIVELEKDIALERRLGLSTYVSERVLKTSKATLRVLLDHRDEIGRAISRRQTGT